MVFRLRGAASVRPTSPVNPGFQKLFEDNTREKGAILLFQHLPGYPAALVRGNEGQMNPCYMGRTEIEGNSGYSA